MPEGHRTQELPKIPKHPRIRKRNSALTRRDFLRRVVGTAIATTTGVGIADILGADEKLLGQKGFFARKRRSSSLQQITNIEPKNVQAAEPTREIDPAHEILTMPLFSQQREDAETRLAENSVRSIESIDRALSVIHCGEDNRYMLLNKRFELHQKGGRETPPLTKEQQEWAAEMGIGPNNLTMSIEAYPYALAVIKQLMPLFRPDMPPDTDPRLLTLTPGGMAALFHMESRGLVDIGSKQALSQINDQSEKFKHDKDDLRILCAWLREDTGLPYTSENIPGSEWVKPGNESGGAIGGQAMPNQQREFYNINKANDLILNPFDPVDAYVIAHEIIARRLVFADGSVREGFVQGDPEQTMYGLRKWNEFRDEVLFTFDRDEDYKRRFMPDLPKTPDIRPLYASSENNTKTA